MKELEGNVALITGGASGIGAALSKLLADLGASVIVTDIQQESGHQLVSSLGSPHQYTQLDVSDPRQWELAVEGVPEINLLVLNAGVTTRSASGGGSDDPAEWLTPKDFSRTVGVNLGGAVFGINACLPLLAPGKATIIVVSSIAGIQPYAGDPLYAASKWALVGLVASLGPSLWARGIRILGVCPHGVDTPIWPQGAAEARRREGTFTSAASMAESIWEIYRSGKPGEVWIGGNQEGIRLHLPENSQYDPANRRVLRKA